MSTTKDEPPLRITGRVTVCAGQVGNDGFAAPEHDDVAILEIGDQFRKRRDRDRVGTKIHAGSVAVADRERRPAPRPDQEVVLASEEESESKSPPQPRQRSSNRLDRAFSLVHFVRDEMGDDFGIGFGGELGAAGLEVSPQLGEILDNAVVHDSDPVGRVRMGIDLRRLAVGCPAGMANAAQSGERLAGEPLFKVLELALGAKAGQLTGLQRGNTGGIIAAIRKLSQRLDHRRRNRLTT